MVMTHHDTEHGSQLEKNHWSTMVNNNLVEAACNCVRDEVFLEADRELRISFKDDDHDDDQNARDFDRTNGNETTSIIEDIKHQNVGASSVCRREDFFVLESGDLISNEGRLITSIGDVLGTDFLHPLKSTASIFNAEINPETVSTDVLENEKQSNEVKEEQQEKQQPITESISMDTLRSSMDSDAGDFSNSVSNFVKEPYYNYNRGRDTETNGDFNEEGDEGLEIDKRLTMSPEEEMVVEDEINKDEKKFLLYTARTDSILWRLDRNKTLDFIHCIHKESTKEAFYALRQIPFFAYLNDDIIDQMVAFAKLKYNQFQ